jgi:predicted RNase H-like HicB family nuclease
MRKYTVVITKDESGAYVAVVPALPGCFTEGRTREEALHNIREATEMMLEGLRSHGDPIPEELGVEQIAVG